MKKLMKKGSSLIVWSLLLAMMFGMSVHAQTVYCLMSQGAGRDPSRNWAPTSGNTRSGVVTLNSGDKIESDSSRFIVKVGDNAEVEAVVPPGSTTGCSEWVYMGAQQTFEWTVKGDAIGFYVTLKPISTSSAAPGEPAPEKPAPAPEKEEDKHEHNW